MNIKKIKNYMLNNFQDHIDSSNELNSTTLAEETIYSLDINEDDEEMIFDIAVDIVPTLIKQGYISG